MPDTTSAGVAAGGQGTIAGNQGGPGARVAVLAGAGALPLEIAKALCEKGRPVRVVALDGLADADFSGLESERVGLGEVSRLLLALKADETREMTIAGGARRPDLLRLRLDLGFFRHLPTILSLMRGGDDAVLRRVARFFEGQGLVVSGVRDLAPELLTPEGTLAGVPGGRVPMDAQFGHATIRALGRFDVGQAVVAEGGQLIAVEAAEGTDGMLRQLASRRVGTGTATLVKATKPGQDLRFDLPAIGPRTVAACARAGIRTIAVEAGASIIIEREKTLAAANAAGVAVMGMQPGQVPPETPEANPGRYNWTELTRRRSSKALAADASLGAGIIDTLRRSASGLSVVVERGHVLAIGVGEPVAQVVARARRSRAWGLPANWRRRSGVVIVAVEESIDRACIDALASCGLAGLAVMGDRAGELVAGAYLRWAVERRLHVLGAA